jgi:hypothetical protein
VGFRIDTNKDCLTNLLDGRDVEDRVGHCHLRVIPCNMDWAVPPPEPPLKESGTGTFQRLVLFLALFAKKGKIGEDVRVWYIPIRGT